MKPELFWLGWVTVWTLMLWIPYIADRFVVWGIRDTLGFPKDPPHQSRWAERAKQAHYNAVENLVVFAPLVLVANAAGISSPAIVGAAQIYLWIRIVHYLVCVFAIPWARTLAFLAGWACQIVIAWQILMR
ncbi:MAG: MAPEG family protein [Candidatus Lambdaproteobacteria bacterium]|nr:MAPEG family protein [Candidatus Lambdaproteobacteria bacterium]